jgi:uncharacterized membrane protein SpoIIM required for sporulation
MAFLVQAEAILMFWAQDWPLWLLLLALIVVNVILVRMGIRIFNREEFLGRQIDDLDIRRNWRSFKGFLLGPVGTGFPASRSCQGEKTRRVFNWLRFYRCDVPQLVRLNRGALAAVLLALLGAIVVGWVYARRYPLPADLIVLEDISRDVFDQFESTGFLPSLTVWGIFSHNALSLLAAGLLASISFGALAILLLMVPVTLIGFLATEVAIAGYNPWVFLGAFVLPHGVVELPAAILATAAAVRLGMSMMAPAPGFTIIQSWLRALAHFLKLFVLVVLPLLALAALIEVHITPEVVLAIFGE